MPLDRHITDKYLLDKYQAVDWEYEGRFHSDVLETRELNDQGD
jgi:hypothetical protein